MNISVSNYLPIKSNYQNKKNNTPQSTKQDCVVLTQIQDNKQTISFKKGFFSRFFQHATTTQIEKASTINDTNVSPYIRSLQEGIKTTFDIDIPAADFSSIMSPLLIIS